MERKEIVLEVEIWEGVTVKKDNDQLLIKGETGEVEKSFLNPKVRISIDSGKVILHTKRASKREKTLINTYRAHILNMMQGAKEGYTYKLKICSGHFPMNVAFQNNKLSIKNFIGEKVPRTLQVDPKVKIIIQGQEIIVHGADKDLVAQTAGSIEQLTRRPGFDKRIFQDGCYIIEKAGRKL